MGIFIKSLSELVHQIKSLEATVKSGESARNQIQELETEIFDRLGDNEAFVVDDRVFIKEVTERWYRYMYLQGHAAPEYQLKSFTLKK